MLLSHKLNMYKLVFEIMIKFFFRNILLTKTVEKDKKDTSTHISKCNGLSLKV